MDKEKANLATYNPIVAAVSHREFEELELDRYSKDGATVIYDIKGGIAKGNGECEVVSYDPRIT